MSCFPKRTLWIAGVVFLATSFGIGTIAYRHYAEVRGDFEPDLPTMLSQHPEQAGIAGLEEISFRTADGLRISGWYVPSQNRAAVVLSHGTNADLSSMLAELRILAGAGFGVLTFDWPGNGASEGKIQWNHSERQALTSAIDWLVRRPEVDPHRVGGLGFSMGGYMMAGVAARDPRVRAVVLQATPTDYLQVIRWQNKKWGLLSELPATLALRNSGMPVKELRPIDVIRDIAPRPILVIQGDLDGTVPPSMAKELFEAAGEPKSLWIVAGALHGSYEKHAGSEYALRLVRFFSDSLEPERDRHVN
jgi:dipeptidyl aminopeptidase/acylaminoacyl peptidase